MAVARGVIRAKESRVQKLVVGGARSNFQIAWWGEFEQFGAAFREQGSRLVWSELAAFFGSHFVSGGLVRFVKRGQGESLIESGNDLVWGSDRSIASVPFMGPLGNGGMTAWWSQFHFLRPEWLFAVPAVIAVGWWLQRRLRSDRQFEDQIAPHLVRHLTVSPDSKRFLTPGALIVPLWLVCVVALAGPTFRQQPAPFADDEAALMLVVRVSDSMMNEDLAPSRLERARVKLASLLEERGNAGNGLIAYNGTAHLVMPVTNDAGVIDHMLEALDPKIMPREGDALAEALDMAEEQLRSTGRDGSILLVTDATQNLPPANETGLSTAVQILAIVREPAELQESGIPELAEQLQSPIHILASDDRDVQAIVSGSKRVLVSAKAGDRSSWRDDGYYLVPLLVLGGLMWARPGWALHP